MTKQQVISNLVFDNAPIFRAPINASSSGNNTIVAAVTGKTIVVLKYKYIASGAVIATWESSGGTILDGPCSLAANGGAQEPHNDHGHFAAVYGEALVLNLSAAVQVGGSLVYCLIG